MRRPLIVGNWKLHKTVGEAIALIEKLKLAIGDPGGREVAIAPPFTALYAVRGALCGTPIALAGQDCHGEEKGAFTGAVSAGMLRDVGCRYVIVGHSERREHFGETDAAIARKLLAALAAGLAPILCLGEKSEDRGRTREMITRQLETALASVERPDRVVIAYEPVWAIGSGTPATPAEAATVADLVRERLAAGWGPEMAGRTRVLYGGSVNATNAGGFLGREEIDGALVGGASLDATTFSAIVEAAPFFEG